MAGIAEAAVAARRVRRRRRKLTSAGRAEALAGQPLSALTARADQERRVWAGRRRLALAVATMLHAGPLGGGGRTMAPAVVALVCAHIPRLGSGRRLRTAAASGDALALRAELRLGVDVNEVDGDGSSGHIGGLTPVRRRGDLEVRLLTPPHHHRAPAASHSSSHRADPPGLCSRLVGQRSIGRPRRCGAHASPPAPMMTLP